MLFANTGTAPRQTLAVAPGLASGAVWLDLLDPSDAERDAARRMTGLDVPARADIAEIESSSRLASEGRVLRLNTGAAYPAEDGRSRTAPLGFVLTPERLVTVRFTALPVFETVAGQLGQGGPVTSMEVFAALLEATVDRVADVLERVANDLDRLSREVFAGEEVHRSGRRADRALRQTLTAVGRAGDTVGNLRDTLLGFGRMVAYVLQMAEDWTPAPLRVRLQTVRQDIASLNDYDQQLSAKVSFLLDATLGFISIEQNNGVKVLTRRLSTQRCRRAQGDATPLRHRHAARGRGARRGLAAVACLCPASPLEFTGSFRMTYATDAILDRWARAAATSTPAFWSISCARRATMRPKSKI